MSDPSTRELRVMPAHDAWRRMRSQSVGRLALCDDGQPEVFPVNFLAEDGIILIRTAAGRKLDILAANERVAFEVDQVALGLIWSVVVKGTARELTDPAEIRSVRASAFWTWPARDADRFIRLDADEITGRQFLKG